jgi:uncharacterized protein (TIGR00369 family)
MPSFNTWLGMEAGPDGSIVLDPRPEHLVAPDTVHFAVLTTLAEVSAAHAVGQAVVPASVTVNLLRRAKLERLEAKGTVVKQGRRLAVAEGEVRQGGELVAKAVVTFAVIRP